MENNARIRPLTPTERKFAEEKYHLITNFLKRSKLNAEEFFDIVVFDFLLSVEIYLNSEDLQKKCNFEAFSYMYMKRVFFASAFWQKLQNIFGECCISKLENVAKPRLAAVLPAA